MQITIDKAQIVVNQLPDGSRMLIIADQESRITVVVPMPVEAARTIGAALTSAIVVASSPLPRSAGPMIQ